MQRMDGLSALDLLGGRPKAVGKSGTALADKRAELLPLIPQVVATAHPLRGATVIPAAV